MEDSTLYYLQIIVMIIDKLLNYVNWETIKSTNNKIKLQCQVNIALKVKP